MPNRQNLRKLSLCFIPSSDYVRMFAYAFILNTPPMHADSIVFSIFLIFTGAALLSTFAMFTKQSLLVAYMVLGMLLGPWGLKLIAEPAIISKIGDVGIIFLLFLLGLHLHPQDLLHMLKKVTWVALISSLVFMAIGFAVGQLFGFNLIESIIIGASMMFSSTIIGLKLLPTTILHHQHTGEVMISVLLMQDIIAIVTLILLDGANLGHVSWEAFGMLALSLPGLLLVAYLAQRFILVKLFTRFDQIKEYVFLVSIGWCLGMAELAQQVGLSADVGAFIAGVALAASPISLYIAESLKPLRDFFLVLFFFAIGATFNVQFLQIILVPAAILALLMMIIKPFLFQLLLRRTGESKHVSWEVGVRLGQASEFSLLIAYIASNAATGATLIGQSASYLIQATTILTFVASSYIVVLKYPTPMALTDRMRQD